MSLLRYSYVIQTIGSASEKNFGLIIGAHTEPSLRILWAGENSLYTDHPRSE